MDRNSWSYYSAGTICKNWKLFVAAAASCMITEHANALALPDALVHNRFFKGPRASWNKVHSRVCIFAMRKFYFLYSLVIVLAGRCGWVDDCLKRYVLRGWNKERAFVGLLFCTIAYGCLIGWVPSCEFAEQIRFKLYGLCSRRGVELSCLAAWGLC